MATLKTLSGKKEGNTQPSKTAPAAPLTVPSTRPPSMTRGKGSISKITGSGIKQQDSTGFYDDEDAKKPAGNNQNPAAQQNPVGQQGKQQGKKQKGPSPSPTGPTPGPIPGPVGQRPNMPRPPTSMTGPIGTISPVATPVNEQIPAIGGFINKAPMPRPMNPGNPALGNTTNPAIQKPVKPPKTAGSKAVPAGATSVKLPFKKK